MKQDERIDLYIARQADFARPILDWVAGAKQAATRERRIAQAVEWIAEGKKRNWKYEKC